MRKLVLILCLLASPAWAQKLPQLPRLPTIGEHASAPASVSPQDLWQKIIGANADDLAYAAALAKSANTNSSLVRLQCIIALQAVNKQASGGNLPLGADGQPMKMPDPSLITHLELAAEVVDNLSPQGPLFTSCAGAAQLFRLNVLQLINGIVTGAVGMATVAPLVP